VEQVPEVTQSEAPRADVPLRILIADDEPAHIEAIRRAFEAAGIKFTIKSAATLRAYRELAAVEPPDIALLDLNFPDGSAVDVLTTPLGAGLFPILVMTSHGDEGKAVQSIKSGALDYIVKSPETFAGMPHSVESALREWKLILERSVAGRSLRDSEARYHQLFEAQSDAILLIDHSTGLIIDANVATLTLYGYDKDELLAKKNVDLSAEPEATSRTVRETPADPTRIVTIPLRLHRRKNGAVFPVEITARFLIWEGRSVHLMTVRDISERIAIEEERKLISRRVARAREEEKRKLAIALHNATGAMVVSLSSSLLVVEEELKHGNASRAIRKVAQMRKLIKEVSSTLKKVCVEIRPPSLETSGLAGTLSQLVSWFSGHGNINISYSIDLPADFGKKRRSSEIIIYRLAQEALTNAVKHSKAKNIQFVVDYDCDKITLVVRDDGRGFMANKPSSKKTSFGLDIMREDAESVGGSFRIDSKPKHGTVIKAEFPLRSRGGGGSNAH